MIILLFHRATPRLEARTAFEDKELHEGWNYGAFIEESAAGCIDLLSADFGIPRTSNTNRVHRRVFYATPRALLILDAQRILFSFWRQLVATLIDDESRLREITNV